MHKINTPEILFTRTELLADPSNPSHAYCSACEKVKHIKLFTRRVPPLLMQKWGWDKLLDKRGATHTFSVCNQCAKKKRPMNYDRLDATLKATGKHEYLVITKNGERMTHRAYLIKQKREEGKQKKVISGRKVQLKKHAPAYATLQAKIKTEIAKVKYQRSAMQSLTEQAQNYLTHYRNHLISLRDSIINLKQSGRKPHPDLTHYINPLSLPTRTARQHYETLGGVERGRVSSTYLF